MQIPQNNFRWYAAFHDEGDHPHVHLMAWSSDPSQGYLTQAGIYSIRSALTNDIFKQEMLHLYEQKSESRDELVKEARRTMCASVQRCFLSLFAIGLNDASVSPPEMTPPIRGTAFDTPFAKVALTIF